MQTYIYCPDVIVARLSFTLQSVQIAYSLLTPVSAHADSPLAMMRPLVVEVTATVKPQEVFQPP